MKKWRAGRGLIPMVLIIVAIAVVTAQGKKAQQVGLPPDFADLSYGPSPRQVLDLWLPQTQGRAPLVVFIHGGGFVGGAKEQIDPRALRIFLQQDWAVASVEYRFATEVPLPAPMRDAGRAIQFLRAKAGDYGLDPFRVAAFGGSAGACTSLWLSLHDDQADPDAADPVLRESTRLRCAAGLAAQTSLDPRVMQEWIGGDIMQVEQLLRVYGFSSYDQALSPEQQPLFDECSPIKHLTSTIRPCFSGTIASPNASRMV